MTDSRGVEGERKGLNALGGYAETQAKTEQKIRMRTKWEGSAARVTPVGAAVGSALLLSAREVSVIQSVCPSC